MADPLPLRAALHRLLDALPDEIMPAAFDALTRVRRIEVPLDRAASPEESGRSLPDRAAFASMLDRLACKAPHVPDLHSSTFPREMIYRDHD